MRKVFITMLCCFLTATMAIAAPVRVPGGKVDQAAVKMGDGKFVIGAGAEFDHMDKMELDEEDEVSTDAAVALISVTYDNKFGVYGTVGQLIDPKYSADVGSTQGEISFDDSMIWGLGLNGIIFESEGLQLFADTSYRTTDDMDLKSFTYGSNSYDKADLDSAGLSMKGEVEEWQVAFGIAKDFEFMKPYIGVKYLDSEFTGKASAGGDTLEGTSNNKDSVGLFLGVVATPAKWVDLNIQGRFFDETAVMGSVTFKF